MNDGFQDDSLSSLSIINEYTDARKKATDAGKQATDSAIDAKKGQKLRKKAYRCGKSRVEI